MVAAALAALLSAPLPPSFFERVDGTDKWTEYGFVLPAHATCFSNRELAEMALADAVRRGDEQEIEKADRVLKVWHKAVACGLASLYGPENIERMRSELREYIGKDYWLLRTPFPR